MRRPPRRSKDGERGATAVIVVLSLFAMFGLIVLTVDVGQLLFKRRAMVNASDAAALAAAQSCARVTDADNPESMADVFAIDNASGLTTASGGIIEQAGCDIPGAVSGYVTVQYQVPQSLFFAGVLGASGSADVRTAATAAWAPASAAGGIMPIVLYSSNLQGNCDLDIDNLRELPDMPPGGPECHFWFDKDILEGASWGFLNLNTWPDPGNTSPYPNCSNTGGADDIGDWIAGGDGTQYHSNYPGATYVCSSSGHVSSNWTQGDTFSNLQARQGQDVIFPVNDPDTDIEGNNGVIQYNIIGYAPLQLMDESEGGGVIQGTDAGGVAPTSCSKTNAWRPTAANPTILLSSISGGGCPGGVTPSGAEDILVGSPGVAPGGNYLYDSVAQALTWTASTFPNNAQAVEFTWWQNGLCGTPPPGQSLSNAVCIRTVWQGIQLGGSVPDLSAIDLGLRGIRLCDRAFPGSCPE
jgi:Flp pilus assembly protein TadG